MANWELVYYETARGRCPVREYLDALGVRDSTAVLGDLVLLTA
jgi:hypothetical protein